MSTPWCRLEQMENSECILCGTCVDNCSKSHPILIQLWKIGDVMKITILNGNPQASGFDRYLDATANYP